MKYPYIGVKYNGHTGYIFRCNRISHRYVVQSHPIKHFIWTHRYGPVIHSATYVFPCKEILTTSFKDTDLTWIDMLATMQFKPSQIHCNVSHFIKSIIQKVHADQYLQGVSKPDTYSIIDL